MIYKGGAKTDGVADLTLNGQTLDDQFGAAVAFAGDLNGDGHSDLAVGAPLRDASGPDAGRVSIYFEGRQPTEPPTSRSTASRQAATSGARSRARAT